MPGVHTFYDGSTLLQPIADITGVDTDKVNLVTCLFLSVPLGYFYQTVMAPGKVSHQVRTAFPLVAGLAICYFCLGWAIKHLLANVLINYGIMCFAPARHVHILVFIVAIGYLTYIHYYRFWVLTEYAVDVTGPMMIVAQKITMLAFSLHDGMARKSEDLKEHQKREAINDVPPLLLYLSYCFHFQTILTGPMSIYVDYVMFVYGTHVTPDTNGKIPSPTKTAVNKLLFSVFLLLLMVLWGGKFYPERLAEQGDLERPFWQWVGIWIICIHFSRIQYYFAWVIADCVCNMSGFGFSGYDKEGKAEWKMMSNVDPMRVEMAITLKEVLDNWNTTSVVWLKRAAFDRAPKKYRTIATYALSAWWHGLFPGYYMNFGTLALFTIAARSFRRSFRHKFVDNHQLAYDVFTFAVTKIALPYATYSFVTMHLYPSVTVYSRVYWIPHILGLLIIVVLPKIVPPPRKPKSETKEIANGTLHQELKQE